VLIAIKDKVSTGEVMQHNRCTRAAIHGRMSAWCFVLNAGQDRVPSRTQLGVSGSRQTGNPLWHQTGTLRETAARIKTEARGVGLSWMPEPGVVPGMARAHWT